MKNLIIRRKGLYTDLFRNYQITMNGLQVGEIGCNKMVEFKIDDMEVKVQGEIDWCKSNIVDINMTNIDNIELEIRNNILFEWAGIISLILIVISYYLNVRSLIYLIIPFVMIFFYFITFGRDKYLVLSKK